MDTQQEEQMERIAGSLETIARVLDEYWIQYGGATSEAIEDLTKIIAERLPAKAEGNDV